ncbi:MAG: FG-GAP-like repeat-containing protein [bacterium]
MRRILKSVAIFTLVVAFIFGIMPFNTKQAKATSFGDASTFVGRIYAGDGNTGNNAYLDFARGMDIDDDGKIYYADTYNNVIRKQSKISGGTVSTLAGTGDYGDITGATSKAKFAYPKDVDVDSDGTVYVADTYNNKIKKIKNGQVTTLVSSGLKYPQGLHLVGSYLYITDTGNNQIKRVNKNGGSVTTLVTGLNAPEKLRVDSSQNYAYIANTGAGSVVKARLSNGSKSTLASGYQTVTGVELYNNKVYFSDEKNEAVRKVSINGGSVSLFANDPGQVQVHKPTDLKRRGNYMYVLNTGSSDMRRFNLSNGNYDTKITGARVFQYRNGSKSSALLGRPTDIIMTSDRKYLYVAENNQIRRITRSSGYTTHIAGNTSDNFRDDVGLAARFSTIGSIVIDSNNHFIYATDRWNNRIRKINVNTGRVTTLAGGGLINTTGSQRNGYKEATGTAARFDNPVGLAISPDDKYLYVADTNNKRIRRVIIATGKTEFIAGSGTDGFADGTGSTAKFNTPYGLTIDSSGNNLYLADRNNHRIRKINLATKAVTTLAGTGEIGARDGLGDTAVFSYPTYVKMGSDGNLYVSEAGSHNIRFIKTSTTSVRLLAGSGTKGFKNSTRFASKFHNPAGMVLDDAGDTLYVCDFYNDQIRSVAVTGETPFAEAAPNINSISPNNYAAQSQSLKLGLAITGSGFRIGARVYIGSHETSPTYVQSDSSIGGEIDINNWSPGYYDVKVTNRDGQTTTMSQGFVIRNADGSYPPRPVDIIPPAPGDSFMAYTDNLRGGYYLGSGNISGSNKAEIITGTMQGLGPQVLVYNNSGSLMSNFFVYATYLRSGVRLATGNVDGSGTDEIVTVAGPGGRPHVRIFNSDGTPRYPGFFALDGKFMGGSHVAVGDVLGRGYDQILISAGSGGGPQITVHDKLGNVLGIFYAYESTFRGGVRIATADFDGDGIDEIITGPENGSSHVQIFSMKNGIKRLTPGFMAFHPNFNGGLSVAGGDIDGDGRDEIIVAQAKAGQAWVKVYNGTTQEIRKTFMAYASNFEGGANVAAADVDSDGKAEVITMPGSNGSPQVRIMHLDQF